MPRSHIFQQLSSSSGHVKFNVTVEQIKFIKYFDFKGYKHLLCGLRESLLNHVSSSQFGNTETVKLKELSQHYVYREKVQAYFHEKVKFN